MVKLKFWGKIYWKYEFGNKNWIYVCTDNILTIDNKIKMAQICIYNKNKISNSINNLYQILKCFFIIKNIEL